MNKICVIGLEYVELFSTYKFKKLEIKPTNETVVYDIKGIFTDTDGRL